MCFVNNTRKEIKEIKIYFATILGCKNFLSRQVYYKQSHSLLAKKKILYLYPPNKKINSQLQAVRTVVDMNLVILCSLTDLFHYFGNSFRFPVLAFHCKQIHLSSLYFQCFSIYCMYIALHPVSSSVFALPVYMFISLFLAYVMICQSYLTDVYSLILVRS